MKIRQARKIMREFRRGRDCYRVRQLNAASRTIVRRSGLRPDTLRGPSRLAPVLEHSRFQEDLLAHIARWCGVPSAILLAGKAGA